MSIRQTDIESFTSGVHNLADEEIIPRDAASDALGWLYRDGRIELMYGRQTQGETGDAGRNLGEWVGYKTNGESVRFRKVWDGSEGILQYFDGEEWQDILGGLSDDDVQFTNYSSLSGNYVYVTSPVDGLFKIVTANPDTAVDVYDSTKNFKGYGAINQARMIMWRTATDKTGLYGSYIDGQDGDVYTTVSGESISSTIGGTNYSGTLGFKSGGATRTCFGVVFTDGTQTITFDFAGVASGDGEGTINFATGEYDITFNATTGGAVEADYQWEDSNEEGVTDFSKSAVRQAGEGFVVRQDAGGDAIQSVVFFEGSYFSFKERSVYQFTLDAADTNPRNELIRTDVGISTPRAASPTSTGIVYLDTANPTRPTLSILQRNPVGDNFVTQELFPQFAFANYRYDDVILFTWDKFVFVACADETPDNDRILVCDMRGQAVSVAPYGVRTFAKDGGFVYGGDPVSQTTYELFTGFDDMESEIRNYWESSGERYASNVLKKVKRLRFRGQIDPNQYVEIFTSLDNGEWQLVGTIRGDADYVDYNSSSVIGGNMIGDEVLGGSDEATIYDYLMEIKVRLPKFRKRKLRFVARGYGYVSVQMVTDFDIWMFQHKLPPQNRSKQNVSLDGTQTDL